MALKTTTIWIAMLVGYPAAFGLLAYATMRSAHLGDETTALRTAALAVFITLACNVRDLWNIYAPVEDPQLQAKAPEIYFPAQMLTYLGVPVLVVMGQAIATVLEMNPAWPPVLLGGFGFWGARKLAENFEARGLYAAVMMTRKAAKHRHRTEIRKRAKLPPDEES